MTRDEFAQYLRPTPFMDYDHPSVMAYARSATRGAATEVEKATRLYYAVRDDIYYDPYRYDLTVGKLRASHTLDARRGFCVPKAVLLAATCRAVGIPSRLGFADVRNHLTTPRLRERMGTDVFVYHGYAELFLNGRWVKATPAFNRSLCERFQVRPLEFDGAQDSIFHPYDATGRRHMEYVRDYGQFADVPLDDIVESFRQHYPGLISTPTIDGDFAEDARPL